MQNEKTIVILQSNYIPWKGYFDLLAAADEFLIFDEVQFTRRDWRNRNKVIVAGKPHWLSIPVQSKGKYEAPIDTMEVSDGIWAEKHWHTIALNYHRAPYFKTIEACLAPGYQQSSKLTLLTEINELFLRTIAGILGITTPILRANIVPRTATDPTERLLEICQARGATTYISGPAAKAYLNPVMFKEAGVDLCFANYSGYPVYDQGGAEFEHGVSMIDTLMRCGPGARDHLKSLRDARSFVDAG